jgi:hypothetical protein
MRTTHREAMPASFSKHASAQLAAGYSEESVLYQMLFGLTSRQRRSLGDGGDLSEFVELIDQKDAVLNQIGQLESELDPLRARWMSAPAGEQERVAKQLNPIFDEIISTIQKTVALEHDNERLLERRRQELSKTLSDVRRWRCPATAKAVPAVPPAVFVAGNAHEAVAAV